jgi:anti-sigma factor (TIGR02949 family)
VRCDELSRNLDAYIDNELDAQKSGAVRTHLDRCPACLRQLRGREALGRVVRSAPYHRAPDRLRAHVIAATRRAGGWTSRWTGRRWATAAMLLLTLGAGTLFFQRLGTPPDAAIDAVVDGHVRSLQANHLVDVVSIDQHTVKPWFVGKLDYSPPVVDLAAAGFPLVGGRLDYLAGRPVAALVYSRRLHTINLFVSPGHGGGRITAASRRGFHVLHWARDDMTFWAVSDLNESELIDFAKGLQP